MDGVIGLGLGFFFGVTFGMFTTALLIAAREEDRLLGYMDGGTADGKDDEG